MEQSPGFLAQGKSDNLICKLHKDLYGLKQSPSAEFEGFSSVLQQFGMLQSWANYSIFYKHFSDGHNIYLVVYDDGIVITWDNHEDFNTSNNICFVTCKPRILDDYYYFIEIEVA